MAASSRDGEILEVHEFDGAPPNLVRWSNGQIGLVFPDTDAHIEHLARSQVNACPSDTENATPQEDR